MSIYTREQLYIVHNELCLLVEDITLNLDEWLRENYEHVYDEKLNFIGYSLK